MTVEELLKAVVIASANDACTALAEFVAGSDGAFVQCMNARTRNWGYKIPILRTAQGWMIRPKIIFLLLTIWQ